MEASENLEVWDMHGEEFLKRVRERAGVEDDEGARHVADAVFGPLRAWVSRPGGESVAGQLPEELKEMWKSGERLRLEGERELDRMNLQEFLARVQRLAKLANTAEAEIAARAVFLTFREQITPETERTVEDLLPPGVRELWKSSSPDEIQEMPFEFEAPVPPSSLETVPGKTPEREPPVRPPVEADYGSETFGPAAASVQRSDRQLLAEIEGLLEASDEVDSSAVDVEVHQGQVTLKGKVRSQRESDAAMRVASEALGTTSVENELAVLGE